MYTIVFSEDAKKDLKELQKKAPQALPKLARLLDELRDHPRTGTGQVEPLKGYLPPSSSNTRPGRAPDGAFASLQVLRFSVGAVLARVSPTVLVQVHFLDPYKHFRLFLLAPVHDWDLYKHSDSVGLFEMSIPVRIPMKNPGR